MDRAPLTWMYGREKIGNAVEDLVLSRESKGTALANVYTNHLMHLKKESVPDVVWAELDELKTDLRRVTDDREGSALASGRRMHHSKVNKHLGRIVGWFRLLPSFD